MSQWKLEQFTFGPNSDPAVTTFTRTMTTPNADLAILRSLSVTGTTGLGSSTRATITDADGIVVFNSTIGSTGLQRVRLAEQIKDNTGSATIHLTAATTATGVDKTDGILVNGRGATGVTYGVTGMSVTGANCDLTWKLYWELLDR